LATETKLSPTPIERQQPTPPQNSTLTTTSTPSVTSTNTTPLQPPITTTTPTTTTPTITPTITTTNSTNVIPTRDSNITSNQNTTQPPPQQQLGTTQISTGQVKGLNKTTSVTSVSGVKQPVASGSVVAKPGITKEDLEQFKQEVFSYIDKVKSELLEAIKSK